MNEGKPYTIDYQGHSIEVVNVEAISCRESWNEYQLNDGNLLKVKLVVTKVSKATNEKTIDGKPLYLIKSQNIVILE